MVKPYEVEDFPRATSFLVSAVHVSIRFARPFEVATVPGDAAREVRQVEEATAGWICIQHVQHRYFNSSLNMLNMFFHQLANQI